MKAFRALPLLAALILVPAPGCGGSSSGDAGPDVSGDVSRTDIEYAGDDVPAGDATDAVADALDVPAADLGPDAPDCTPATSAFGFRNNCNGTVTDTKTGLMWEWGYAWAGDLDAAKRDCNLGETGGYTDWRLPTIDEVRSLILGCPDTAPTGACPVHDSTLCEDHSNASCWTDKCYGCAMNQGPAANPADPTKLCYMDASFQWYCNLYWSATQVQAKVSGDKRSWFVTFYNAGIDVPPTMDQVQVSAVKCVRGP